MRPIIPGRIKLVVSGIELHLKWPTSHHAYHWRSDKLACNVIHCIRGDRGKFKLLERWLLSIISVQKLQKVCPHKTSICFEL